MSGLIQQDIFFFISSIGFIVLGVLLAVFLYYLIRSMYTLSRILNRAEDDIEKIGDITREMVEDIEESGVFKFLFGKKRRKKK